MVETVALLLGLLVLVIAASLAARAASFPEPLAYVPIGVAVSFVPGIPEVALDPDIVLHLFLPLLVYATAIEVPWKEFRANLRPIGFLAFGLVAFTTAGVAALAHAIVPGLSWPAAFALGAIISPPDEVAAAAVIEQLPVPRRIAVILSGEGLVNDVTALTIFRFSVLAAISGTFSAGQASLFFSGSLVGEALYGYAVGWVALRARSVLDDPRLETTVSLMTPFVAYLVPEHLGSTGVLATAVAGLVVNAQAPRMISAETRLNAMPLWDMIDFLLNGLLFVMLGLQIKHVWSRVPDANMPHLALVTAAIGVALIALRFLWVYVTVYWRGLWRAMEEGDRAPRGNRIFLIAWTGMRGAISLAAALALPMSLPTGEPFPARDFIIFVTFAIILLTLVVQGASLPFLIRRLGLDKEGRREDEKSAQLEYEARIRMVDAGLAKLDALCRDGKIPPEAAGWYRDDLEHRRGTYERHRRAHPDRDRRRKARGELKALIEVAAAERDELLRLRSEGKIHDDTLRRIERDLDEQELRLESRRDRLG